VNEALEVHIVAPPNAVSNPWAVMVELVHAVVTNRAVLGAWRAIDTAGATPLEFDPPLHLLDKVSFALLVCRF